MKAILILGFLLIASVPGSTQSEYHHQKQVLKLMGTRFEISAVASDQAAADQAVIKAIEEIKRIESLISSWQDDSQTTLINKNAGVKPVKVDIELFELIFRSKKVSKLTQGAFDISFASIERLYKFDQTEQQLPNANVLSKSVKNISWEAIELDRNNLTVYLSKKNMKIGFGAIGKGYAANKACDLMQEIEGVKGGVVNAAGDLMVWGENGKGGDWPIQITDPDDMHNTLAWLNIEQGAIVTSGDYEKYFLSNGVRYAHIIDPHTGLPCTGIKSVSLVSPDAELADALATSIFVLGIDKGLELINKLKDTEVLIVTDDDEIITSDNLSINKV